MTFGLSKEGPLGFQGAGRRGGMPWRILTLLAALSVALTLLCIPLLKSGEGGVSLLGVGDERELEAVQGQDEALGARIHQLERIRNRLSSKIVGGDMAHVMHSGGEEQLKYLREMASDAGRIKKLTSMAANQVEQMLVKSSEARKGECHAGNRAWMSVECTLSCSLCAPSPQTLSQSLASVPDDEHAQTPTHVKGVSTQGMLREGTRDLMHSVHGTKLRLSWPQPGHHIFADGAGLMWPTSPPRMHTHTSQLHTHASGQGHTVASPKITHPVRKAQPPRAIMHSSTAPPPATTLSASALALAREEQPHAHAPHVQAQDDAFEKHQGATGERGLESMRHDAVEDRMPVSVGSAKRGERVEVHVTLRGVPLGELGRSDIEAALLASVAKMGPGIAPTDVGMDSVEAVSGSSSSGHGARHKRRGSRSRFAMIREHVYGTARPMEATDAFYDGTSSSSPGRRHLLMSHATSEQLHRVAREPQVHDVDVRFHVVVPPGADRREVITTLKRVLQQQLRLELQARGVRAANVSVRSVRHTVSTVSSNKLTPAQSPSVRVHARTDKQQVSFASWARKYLLGGSDHESSPKPRSERQARQSELAWDDQATTQGHKVSGLERHTHPRPPPSTYKPSLDHGLELLDGPGSGGQHGAGGQTTGGSGGHGKSRQGPNRLDMSGDGAEDRWAMSAQPKEEFEWKYEPDDQGAPEDVPDYEVPADEECGKECQEGRAVAEQEHKQDVSDKIRTAREHVIEDANTLKHLLDAVAEEELLLHAREANETKARADAQEGGQKHAEGADKDGGEAEDEVDVPEPQRDKTTEQSGSTLATPPSSSTATTTSTRTSGVTTSAAADGGAVSAHHGTPVVGSGGLVSGGGAQTAVAKARTQDLSMSMIGAHVSAYPLPPAAAALKRNAHRNKQEVGRVKGDKDAAVGRQMGAIQHRRHVTSVVRPPGVWAADGKGEGGVSVRALERQAKKQAEMASRDDADALKEQRIVQEARWRAAQALTEEHAEEEEAKKDEDEVKEEDKEKDKEETPVNVQVHANIDSPTAADLPEWYRKELAARKAFGSDKGAFHLNLGINVASPHYAPSDATSPSEAAPEQAQETPAEEEPTPTESDAETAPEEAQSAATVALNSNGAARSSARAQAGPEESLGAAVDEAARETLLRHAAAVQEAVDAETFRHAGNAGDAGAARDSARALSGGGAYREAQFSPVQARSWVPERLRAGRRPVGLGAEGELQELSQVEREGEGRGTADDRARSPGARNARASKLRAVHLDLMQRLRGEEKDVRSSLANIRELTDGI